MLRMFLALALILAPTAALADVVITSDRVVNGVNIREEPSSSSQILGLLRPGEELDHLGSVPNWHRVRVGGGEGFVSSAWTVVVHGEAPAPAVASEAAGAFDFWLSEALIQKLANQNTLMFPMRLRLTHRSKVHTLSSDCEIHIAGHPLDVEDLAAPPAVVVEPPNLCKNPPPAGTWENHVDEHFLDRDCTVTGFPRIYDEHLVGDETPTNPHHMLEIHPALTFDCGDGVLDLSGFLAYHEGMSEIQPSSAAKCFDTELWVRRNASQHRYEFRAKRHKHCGNFASFELSVFREWIRELSTGGHSALVRVRPEGLPFHTLKVYTYTGTEADDLMHQFEQTSDPHHGAYFHGMMTFDYFSILKVLRTPQGTWNTVNQWTEVPFPLAMVVFGSKQDPDPDEHD